MALKLYSYWRSSAAWRVRIALNLKGLTYETVPVHLVNDGGEQYRPDYRQLSPDALVPSLVEDDWCISQSLAICEYLEARWPSPALLPHDPREAAAVRSFCAAIACDIHPLNNLRVLNYLSNTLDASDTEKNAWYLHWLRLGFEALEMRLAQRTTEFAFGDKPGMAECFLIPQLYNARRFSCPLEAYPQLLDLESRCTSLTAFMATHPDQQIDKPHD